MTAQLPASAGGGSPSVKWGTRVTRENGCMRSWNNARSVSSRQSQPSREHEEEQPHNISCSYTGVPRVVRHICKTIRGIFK